MDSKDFTWIFNAFESLVAVDPQECLPSTKDPSTSSSVSAITSKKNKI